MYFWGGYVQGICPGGVGMLKGSTCVGSGSRGCLSRGSGYVHRGAYGQGVGTS